MQNINFSKGKKKVAKKVAKKVVSNIDWNYNREKSDLDLSKKKTNLQTTKSKKPIAKKLSIVETNDIMLTKLKSKKNLNLYIPNDSNGERKKKYANFSLENFVKERFDMDASQKNDQ